MAKKEKPEMISTTAFAERMAVNYRTALNWLRAGLVPGAIEHQLPGGAGNYWEIPVTALVMDKPKPGPKKGSKRVSTNGEVSTATKRLMMPHRRRWLASRRRSLRLNQRVKSDEKYQHRKKLRQPFKTCRNGASGDGVKCL
jgi:hypothetical protein